MTEDGAGTVPSGPTNEDDERPSGAGNDGRGLGRTLALSDGIFAIAMTLLAFQIQPSALNGKLAQHHLTRALGKLGDQYFVFFLSFAVIGLLWLAHHRLFNRIGRADELLMTLNLLFLMTVAALPFPSGVLGQYGSQRAAVVLYAASMAVAGTLLGLLTLVASRRALLVPGTDPKAIRKGLARSVSMAAVFALSIPVAFVFSPSVASDSWALVWVCMQAIRLATRSGKRKSRRPAAIDA
jgi:uncharacterized membrane protein